MFVHQVKKKYRNIAHNPNFAIAMVVKSLSSHDSDAEDSVDYKKMSILPTDLVIPLSH